MRVTAGGSEVSNAVDMYNSASGTWSTAQLSVARGYLAATSVGHVAIFAGGWDGNCIFTLFVEGLLVWVDACGRWCDVCVIEARGLLFVVFSSLQCMRIPSHGGHLQVMRAPMLLTCTTAHLAHGRLRSSVWRALCLLRHLLGTWPSLRVVTEVIAV